MKKVIRFLNKRGITTDILVIVLLIVALALAAVLYLTFGMKMGQSQDTLFNLTEKLK